MSWETQLHLIIELPSKWWALKLADQKSLSEGLRIREGQVVIVVTNHDGILRGSLHHEEMLGTLSHGYNQ